MTDKPYYRIFWCKVCNTSADETNILCHIHKPMTDKTIIEEWVEAKDRDNKTIDELMLCIEAYRSPQAHVEPKEFMEATKFMIEKFVKYQNMIAEKQAANDICKLIDKIELSYHGSSLEEWKAWKHIRNAIRDKYDLKGFQEDKNK